MKHPSRATIAYKALRELGVRQVGLYGLYKFGLLSGHYQRVLSAGLSRLGQMNSRENLQPYPCLARLPDRDAMLSLLGDQISRLYALADEIVAGKIRLFGGPPVPLNLEPAKPLRYWTDYENSNNGLRGEDIKLIWEPARFGWSITLAMAYHLSNNERFADAFWQYTEQFITANPPYLGPQWSSAQEAGIRVVALAFAIQVFKDSRHSTQERLETLAKSIAIHAERIPPTLIYARSQNNNHLISEALGLYTASALLPKHPMADRWHRLGWKWLEYAFINQIDPDGSYCQHSTNYHRMMLQAATWAFAVHGSSFGSQPIADEVVNRLKSTTQWLSKLMDPDTGCVPNLGHNDGSNILPLTVRPYHDYRPVLSAAAQYFLGEDTLPEGTWKDMGFWLSGGNSSPAQNVTLNQPASKVNAVSYLPPNVIANATNRSWAYFRIANFHSRPAHADQLHMDLWWHGLNVACDPGTYLYNASPPWDNSLTSASVHNTVTIDGSDTMQKISKFLYLDWAQAELNSGQISSPSAIKSFTAHHNGYRMLGITHTRTITTLDDGSWEVIDRLDGATGTRHSVRLHWLLPDWSYNILERREQLVIAGFGIQISSPDGNVGLVTQWTSAKENDIAEQPLNLTIARAGERIYGSGEVLPINGWISPTYGVKEPALAYILEVSHSLPIELKSTWTFPDES
jgi:hypothetical protein